MNVITNLISFYTDYINFFYLIIGILFLFSITGNLFVLLIPKKGTKHRAISNLLTIFPLFLILSVNIIYCLLNVRFLNGYNLDCDFLFNIFKINNSSILIQLLINSFFFIFILNQKRLFQKTKNMAIITNLQLMITALISNLLAFSNNFIISYIFLEIICFLCYAFASIQNEDKKHRFSIEYILINSCAGLLFILFYISRYIISDSLQLSILEVVLALSLFLKIGIFPIFNFTLNNQHKNNISFCTLCCFIGFIGIICFNHLSNIINFESEVFKYTTSLFILLSILTSSIFAFKQKNISNFILHLIAAYYGFYTLYSIFYPLSFENIILSGSYLLIALGLYSILSSFNINKITIKSIKGMYYQNPLITHFFTILLLISLNVIPSYVFMENSKELVDIYTNQNILGLIIIPMVLANFLILINVLKIIKSCYNYSFNEKIYINEKRTKSIKFALFSIILFLILKIFI